MIVFFLSFLLKISNGRFKLLFCWLDILFMNKLNECISMTISTNNIFLDFSARWRSLPPLVNHFIYMYNNVGAFVCQELLLFVKNMNITYNIFL